MDDDCKERLAAHLEDLARQVRAGDLSSEVWVTSYAGEYTALYFGTRPALMAHRQDWQPAPARRPYPEPRRPYPPRPLGPMRA